MRQFEFVTLESLNFDLKAETTEQGRKYLTPSGNLYPSVTTVLSSYNKKQILEWRNRVGDETANKIAGKASRRGTSVHYVCEQYLLNLMNDMRMKMMMPNVKELFLQLRNSLDENIGKIYCLEQALYSDQLKIAGRVDCIAEWQGKLSVIDFKTSTKKKDEDNILNYFMQCSAYAEMFEELTSLPIEQIVVAIATEEGESQFFVRKKKDYLENLRSYVSQYHGSTK